MAATNHRVKIRMHFFTFMLYTSDIPPFMKVSSSWTFSSPHLLAFTLKSKISHIILAIYFRRM